MITAIYAIFTAIRFALAHGYQRRWRTADGPPWPVTIVQPILSGDPDLPSTLHATAQANPDAQILWLIDDDDAPAHQIATPPNVRILRSPPPQDGENPKLAKLQRALNEVRTPALLVLDDDTVLTETVALTQALHHADLVTGMPRFRKPRGLYERLIEAFVNGNAVLTYLPASALGAQRTINGMVYAVKTGQLKSIGGFAAAGHELTDDYAVARLYQRNHLRILQAPIFATVGITVRDFPHCVSILRRWMIFANRYLRDNAAGSLLAGLPVVLPLTALALGEWRLIFPALFAKSLINRRRIDPQIPLEVLSDLLLPLWWLLSLYRPTRVRWRTRNMDVSSGSIRYR